MGKRSFGTAGKTAGLNNRAQRLDATIVSAGWTSNHQTRSGRKVERNGWAEYVSTAWSQKLVRTVGQNGWAVRLGGTVGQNTCTAPFDGADGWNKQVERTTGVERTGAMVRQNGRAQRSGKTDGRNDLEQLPGRRLAQAAAARAQIATTRRARECGIDGKCHTAG